MRIVVVNLAIAKRASILIDRGTLFGNRNRVTQLVSRQVAIARYRHYIKSHPEIVEELATQTLSHFARGADTVTYGCHCKPEECHGDYLRDEVRKVITVWALKGRTMS